MVRFDLHYPVSIDRFITIMKKIRIGNLTLPVLATPTAAPAPAYNSFRDVAVTFDADAAQALRTVRRLADVLMSQAWSLPEATAPARTYELMMITLLLPGQGESLAVLTVETGTVVMSTQQHRALEQFLRRQTYHLIRDKRSPLAGVSADALYNDLMTVLHVVDNYTSIVPLWN